MARASGKSISTVSVALSGRAGVSDATRAVVLEAANRLGWRPDRRASILRRQDSHLVGVMYEVEQTFQARLLDALYVEAGGAGLELVLTGATAHHDERASVAELLRDRCQAIMLTGSELTDAEIGDVARHLPTLNLCRPVRAAGVDSVVCDEDMGLGRAVDHLVRLGHRDVAHVDGGGRNPLSRRRADAYARAMRERGLGDMVRVFPGGSALADGVAAAREIAACPTPPTGITCYNDVCAAGLVRELRRCGLGVPEDISVIGFDDGPEAADPSTSLTTICQDPLPLAHAAMTLVRTRILDGGVVVWGVRRRPSSCRRAWWSALERASEERTPRRPVRNVVVKRYVSVRTSHFVCTNAIVGVSPRRSGVLTTD